MQLTNIAREAGVTEYEVVQTLAAFIKEHKAAGNKANVYYDYTAHIDAPVDASGEQPKTVYYEAPKPKPAKAKAVK